MIGKIPIPKWGRMHALWQPLFERYSGLPAFSCDEATFFNPHGRFSGWDAAVTWVVRDEIAKFTHDLQKFLSTPPNLYPYSPLPANSRKGEMHTARLIGIHRENPVAVSAILSGASLFSRDRHALPDAGRVLYKSIERYLNSLESDSCFPLWDHPYTNVLPTARFGVPRMEAVTRGKIIEFLAQEHAGVYQLFSLFIFRLTTQPTELSRQVDEELALEAAERERVHRAWEDSMRQRDEAFKRRLEKHPLCNKWPLGDEELTRLVWTKPLTELAKLFGISNVAVAKHCRKKGIPLPGRGFWRQVETGRIPHPNGAPPKIRKRSLRAGR